MAPLSTSLFLFALARIDVSLAVATVFSVAVTTAVVASAAAVIVCAAAAVVVAAAAAAAVVATTAVAAAAAAAAAAAVPALLLFLLPLLLLLKSSNNGYDFYSGCLTEKLISLLTLVCRALAHILRCSRRSERMLPPHTKKRR